MTRGCSRAQIVAQATCTAIRTTAGHTVAVKRECSNSGLTCAQACSGLGGGTTCFNSLHVYVDQPTDLNYVAGLAVHRYEACGGGCGPNYCCCNRP